MMRLGRERDNLGVVFDQVGTPTYANDLASAIYAIINKGVVPGIYHFSEKVSVHGMILRRQFIVWRVLSLAKYVRFIRRIIRQKLPVRLFRIG